MGWLADSMRQLALKPIVALYKGRGRVYDALGDHDRAKSDFDQAVELGGIWGTLESISSYYLPDPAFCTK